MHNCPFPNFKKYLRYAAYVELRDAILAEVKSYNVDRPSTSRLWVTIHKHDLDLTTKYVVEDISVYDDVDVMLSKKYATEFNDAYRDYVHEAASSFVTALSNTDRPTVATITKLLNKCIDSVVADLLDVTH